VNAALAPSRARRPTAAIDARACPRSPALFSTIRERLERGVADGDLTASPAGPEAIARYYTTVVQGLSVQARDGASRADLEAVITCAMAAWETLASAER